MAAMKEFSGDRNLVRDRYLDSPLVEKLTDGSILCWLRVGASDRILDYGDHQETIRADQLFDSESIKSLKGVPVTLDHPPGFFFENAYIHGGSKDEIRATRDDVRGIVLQEFRKDGGFLAAAACIFDPELIAAIESGKIEVSPGYSRSTVRDSATGEILQTDRIYDHVAIVSRGRAGSEVSVKLDNADKKPIPSEVVNSMSQKPVTDDSGFNSESNPEANNSLKVSDLFLFLKKHPSALTLLPEKTLAAATSIESLEKSVKLAENLTAIETAFKGADPVIYDFKKLSQSGLTSVQSSLLIGLMESITSHVNAVAGKSDGTDGSEENDPIDNPVGGGDPIPNTPPDDGSEDDTAPDLNSESKTVGVETETESNEPKSNVAKDSKPKSLKAVRRDPISPLEAARKSYIAQLSSNS